MSRDGRPNKAKWTLAAILFAGVCALVFLPLRAFKDVTQELIALFGLMMAGVLPTMVLTASVLRAGNLSVKKLQAYRDALRSQLVIWIGLFLISLGASLLVIIGKMVDWSIVIQIPISGPGHKSIDLDLIRVLNALIVIFLSLLVLRAVEVGNGIISLLGLSAELAISEAQVRDEARHREAEEAIEGMLERKSFGDYIDSSKH